MSETRLSAMAPRLRQRAGALRDVVTGRRPVITGSRYRWAAYRRLQKASRNPVTFNEKIRYKAAYDRNPLLHVFADKVAVRDYVADKVGDQYLATLYQVAPSPSLIAWHELPREYACKVNHGSGGVILSWEGADPDAKLPDPTPMLGWTRHAVRPEWANPAAVSALLDYWLGLDFAWTPGKFVPEWAYEGIPRKVLVEELLVADGNLAMDYKFHVFHGRAQLVRAFGRLPDGTKGWRTFDRDWNTVPIRFREGNHVYPLLEPAPAMPVNYAELLQVAEALGQDTDFVRVDMYDVEGRIVVGELTNYPTCGLGIFIPQHADYTLGSYWNLSYGPDAKRS